MRDAIQKVSSAVATKTLVPALTHYVIYSEMIHASDGRIIAAAPFPSKEAFAVPAREFDDVLRRLPGDVKMSLTDSNVTLSAGKFKGRVQRHSADKSHFLEPSGKKIKAPEKLSHQLSLMRPFISDNASQQYAICLCLRGGRILATNNVVLVVCDESGLPKSLDVMLPCWAVDYVIARKDAALLHLQYDEKSISFIWDDGSWMRSQVLTTPFPNVDSILDSADDPDFEITAEWREAFAVVAGMSETCIRFYADKMVGGIDAVGEAKQTTAELEAKATTATPEGYLASAWNPKFLEPVIKAANYWKPDAFPRPASFAGDELFGVVIGRALNGVKE